MFDAKLPRRLARWLQERGHDVVHTQELAQRNRTPDPALLAQANMESRILVTKDADFQLSFELGKGPSKLLLVTTGNIHNDELLAFSLSGDLVCLVSPKQIAGLFHMKPQTANFAENKAFR